MRGRHLLRGRRQQLGGVGGGGVGGRRIPGRLDNAMSNQTYCRITHLDADEKIGLLCEYWWDATLRLSRLGQIASGMHGRTAGGATTGSLHVLTKVARARRVNPHVE